MVLFHRDPFTPERLLGHGCAWPGWPQAVPVTQAVPVRNLTEKGMQAFGRLAHCRSFGGVQPTGSGGDSEADLTGPYGSAPPLDRRGRSDTRGPMSRAPTARRLQPRGAGAGGTAVPAEDRDRRTGGAGGAAEPAEGMTRRNITGPAEELYGLGISTPRALGPAVVRTRTGRRRHRG
jgi:hypothetical protein